MQKLTALFVNLCPTCGDYIEPCENCANCEREGFAPFDLERAIEQAESVSELFNLR